MVVKSQRHKENLTACFVYGASLPDKNRERDIADKHEKEGAP